MSKYIGVSTPTIIFIISSDTFSQTASQIIIKLTIPVKVIELIHGLYYNLTDKFERWKLGII